MGVWEHTYFCLGMHCMFGTILVMGKYYRFFIYCNTNIRFKSSKDKIPYNSFFWTYSWLFFRWLIDYVCFRLHLPYCSLSFLMPDSFSLSFSDSGQNGIFSSCSELCIDWESPKLNIHTALLIINVSVHSLHTLSANHFYRRILNVCVCESLHLFLLYKDL